MSLKEIYEQQIAKKNQKVENKRTLVHLISPAQSGWKELADLVKPEKWTSYMEFIPVSAFCCQRSSFSGYLHQYVKLKDPGIFIHCVNSNGENGIYTCGGHYDIEVSVPVGVWYLWCKEEKKKENPKEFLGIFSKIELNSYRNNAIKKWQKQFEPIKQKIFEEMSAKGLQLAGSQQCVLLSNKSYNGRIYDAVLFRDGYYCLLGETKLDTMEKCLTYIHEINEDLK